VSRADCPNLRSARFNELVITTREQLRMAQAPLKERYRSNPDEALNRVHATASFSDPGITATVDREPEPVRAGLHRATGGDGTDACSGDLLMEALVACAGVTLRSVATAMGLEIRSAHLVADAVFDARGTLAVDREIPVGVQQVRVVATLDSDAEDAQLDRLAAATERYCVVAQSLHPAPTFTVRRA
jgi:uncharacterized OsmC-like protein